MCDTDRIMQLEQENAKLKQENDMLKDIIAQMKETLNRLIDRYMTHRHEVA